MSKPHAKKIFGLGVTQCSSFLIAAKKNAALSEKRIEYVSSISKTWPKKADLVVVDGLKPLIKHNDRIRPNQVIVVSECPALLRQVQHIEALDYNMQRSFEFIFKPFDLRTVNAAFGSKGTVAVDLSSTQTLGYHVDQVRRSDNMVAKFVAMTSNLDFAQRETIYSAFLNMCNQPKYNPGPFYNAIDRLPENEFIDAAIDEFLDLFDVQGKNYYQAIRSNEPPPVAAKRFGVDSYGVSFFRRKIKAINIAKSRIPKGDHHGRQ